MAAIDLSRLHATLGAPGFARLREALRRRLELGRPLTGTLSLAGVAAEERKAYDGLAGRRPTTGDTLMVDLDEMASLLRSAGIAENLNMAIEALMGPVANRRAREEEEAAAWEDMIDQANSWLEAWPVLQVWKAELSAQGLVKRMADGDPEVAGELLRSVARVAATLPAAGEPIAAVAARLFGDAHALDPGSPRASLAVRAAARLGGVAFADDAEGRRAAWASVGVLCDELSSPALVLNLPASVDSPLARLLIAARTAGEPIHLTLRLLLRHPLAGDPILAHRDVFVCENPTIIALAATALGSHCAPLICVNGQPATPVQVLLRQFAAAGARIRYHGDFDWAGLQIAQGIFSQSGALPWRMADSDYLAAPPGMPLEGGPVASPWCPPLSSVMSRVGRAVHEEAVADVLLKDLEQTGLSASC